MRPILENHLPHVYRYALRLTRDIHAAEDLAQEAFVRAWTRREQLGDPHQARLWLFSVTANLWRDEKRKVNTHHRHQGNVAAHAPRRNDHTGPSSVDDESVGEALAILDQLPERQREVLYLTACEGLSPGEIGSILEISSRAVISSLSVARQKVREMIESSRAAEVRS